MGCNSGFPKGSRRYLDALATLLSSDHEQKSLYTLSDCLAVEQMLDVLELVSVARACSFSMCVLVSETVQPGGVAGDQFKT